MNKKILAAALAAVAFGPAAAFADPAGVTLYGKLDVDLDVTGTADSKAATPSNQPSRARIGSSSSNLGVKGTEPLADGVSAIFQIESSVPAAGSISPSTTAVAGAAPISGTVGTLGSRNTQVGLAGTYGTIFYGIWDTPYKSSTLPYQLTWGDATPWDYITILSGNVTPTSANGYNRNSFDRRQENSVQYWSPNFNGLQFKAVYSVDSSRPASTATPANTNPALYGFSLVYDKDGMFGSLAYERHIDYGVNAATFNSSAPLAGLTVTGTTLTATTSGKAPTATIVNAAKGGQSSDFGVKLALGYTYAPTSTAVGLIAERLDYTGSLGTTTAAGLTTTQSFTTAKQLTDAALAGATEARISSYYMTLRQGVGEHGTIRASYGFDQGLELNGTAGNLPSSRARASVIGYSYNMSKRTDLYAMFLQINNDTNSKNDVGGSQPTSGVTQGATVRSLGAGIRHTF